MEVAFEVLDQDCRLVCWRLRKSECAKKRFVALSDSGELVMGKYGWGVEMAAKSPVRSVDLV